MPLATSNDDHQLMDQHDDNSGEQTDSGISSTFTNDIEQIFADTVNNVRSSRRRTDASASFAFQFLVNSNLNCSSSNGHDMTFLNNSSTTVLPDFQYLTSPSSDQQLTSSPAATTTTTTTTNHIPVYPIPKSADCNQYGNNITNNNHSNINHVSRIAFIRVARLHIPLA